MVSREYVKGDLPEKAAILQRDGETYAIAPHIPGGIVYPETLRKIADIAEKYGAAALKLTSAQRIAIVGLKEKDLDAAWGELNLKPGAAIGLCVRSIKICPGTTFCKRGKQDAVGLGLKLAASVQVQDGGFRLPELMFRTYDKGYRAHGYGKRLYSICRRQCRPASKTGKCGSEGSYGRAGYGSCRKNN